MVEGEETIILQEDPDFLEELSEYLDVLSSSTRLKILKSIEKRPKDIREISAEIETSYENTKKHLDRLLKTGVIRKEAGLSRPTSKGIHPVWKYSLIPGGLEAIIRNLGVFSNINLTLTSRDLDERLRAVQEIISEELTGDVPILVLLGGPDDGRAYPITKDITFIGRADPKHAHTYDEEHDIAISDHYGAVTRISKPHARIIRSGSLYYLEDTGSTGGTLLNNQPLGRSMRSELKNGDLIDLGKGMQAARFVFNLPQHQ